MSAVIHILIFNNEDCTTHVINFEQIGYIKFRYVNRTKVGFASLGKGKEKFDSIDFSLLSGGKISISLNGKAVFRIINDDDSIQEGGSLKWFEKSLIKMIQGNGVYQPIETQSEDHIVV